MSGISILKRLLMKEAMKRDAPFQKEGIMSISKSLATNVDSKVNRIVEGAKKQGIDFDQYNEEQVKYILELNRPKLQPRVISQGDPEFKKITEAMLGGKKGKVIKADFGKPFAKEVESMEDIADARLIKDMYRTAGPRNLDEDAGYLAEFIAEDAGKIFDDLSAEQQRIFKNRAKKALRKNVKKYKTEGLERTAKVLEANQKRKLNVFKNLDDNKKLTDDEYEEFLEELGVSDEYLEAYDFDGTAGSAKKILKDSVEEEQYMFDQYRKGKLDPEDMATGGRAGFDKGGMSRRKFMQIMGGLAALPVVGKFFKVGKVASKVPQFVKTQPVAGKPEWFDSLVNKVIAEGDDVTKKLATKEREIVHTKKIDEDSTVTVTRDLDEGIVRVEYDSPENTFADTVQLQYRKPLPDEANPNPKAQFDVAESGPVGRSVGPEDYEIELDEVGGTSIRHLDSDVSKLKEYATGKKPTLKEFVQNKKRKDKAKAITEDPAAQSDAVTARQGEYDGPYEDDFASGGIARLLGE